MKMTNFSDRSLPYLARLGRPIIYAIRGFLVVAMVFVSLSLYLAGVEQGSARSCEGHLRGSVFGYECYNTTVLPLCFDIAQDEVKVGYGFPRSLVDP